MGALQLQSLMGIFPACTHIGTGCVESHPCWSGAPFSFSPDWITNTEVLNQLKGEGNLK